MNSISCLQHRTFLVLALLCCASQSLCGQDRDTSLSHEPPTPRRADHAVDAPYGSRVDPYYWLRDDSRQSDEVMSHLQAENRYARGTLDHLRPSMGELLFEMRRRVDENDCGVPVTKNGHYYRTCFSEGRQYPVHTRRTNLKQRKEQVLLDLNERANGLRYFALGSMVVSPDNRLLAWTEDRVGQRRFELHIKEIASGKELLTPVTDVDASLAWSNDSLLYVAKDPRTMLGNRVMRHRLGGAVADTVVYTEPDNRYFLNVRRSRSERFVMIGSSSTESTEWRYARSDDPSLGFQGMAWTDHF